MRHVRGLFASLLVLAITAVGATPSAAAPDSPSGQMIWAVHISLAPTWFDPAETSGIITPFMVLYALHDAMLKPLPGSAEDVKFSFERYRGASAKPLKDSVAAIETPDLGRVRFRLKRPWPDFMTFYIGATGASWIVPKKYVEKVGDE